MGKLKSLRKKYSIILFGLAVMLLIGFFILFQSKEKRSEFVDYIQNNNLVVGSQSVDGQGQIYYEYKGERTYITNDKSNHLSPESSGRYIVWLDESGGKFQIVLYDVIDKSRLELSAISSNTNPSIDGNRVAWETKTDDNLAILYFDGTSIKKISAEHTAIRPFVKGDRVLFTQQVSENKWQAVLYDSGSKQSKVVAEGSADDAAWPRFEGEKVMTTNQGSAKYYY